METNLMEGSSINVNTDTTAIEKGTQQSGPMSFEELEASTSTSKRSASDTESKPQRKETKSKQESTETESDSQATQETPGEKPIAKSFKVKHGDKVVEVYPDMPLDVKVNGKSEKVPLQELINNYSGKTNWDRKYSDLNKEQQAFQGRVLDLQNHLTHVHDLASKGNPRAAIAYLSELMGADSEQVWKTFSEQANKYKEEWMNLSPEERNQKLMEEELNYLKQQDKTRKEQTTRKAQLDSVRQQMIQTSEKLGLSEQDFWGWYDQALKSGKYNENTITVADVESFYGEHSKQNQISEVLKEAEIDAELTAKAQAELYDVWKLNPKLKAQDIREIAASVYGGKAAKNLARKVKRAEPSNTVKPSASRKAEPVTWDDLD